MHWKKIAPWNWFKGSKSQAHLKALDGGKSYTVRVALPGIKADDVSVEVEGHTLALRAEKREEREVEEDGYRRSERSYGAVQRVLSLPDDVDGEGIEANFADGVLTLRIPRHGAPAPRGRHIEIQAG